MPDLEEPYTDATQNPESHLASISQPVTTNNPLHEPHSDPIRDLNLPVEEDQSNFQDSQLSPVTAAGAPSIQSQWEDDLHSAVTTHGAQSIPKQVHNVVNTSPTVCYF